MVGPRQDLRNERIYQIQVSIFKSRQHSVTSLPVREFKMDSNWVTGIYIGLAKVGQVFLSASSGIVQRAAKIQVAK